MVNIIDNNNNNNRLLEHVRKELNEKVGIIPSNEWLEAACLQFTTTTNPSLITDQQLVEEIWNQLLLHDLRDVIIRDSNSNNNNNNNNNIENQQHASIILRKAIYDSINNDIKKVTLPTTFRLLVQLEEFIDMSVNVEKRFVTTNNNNSNNRCLKICYSDGYLHNDNNNNINNIMIAMELIPIPNLHIQSPAGIKVLLQGPIIIRNGIAGWDPCNAIVLGGYVDYMMKIQQHSIELAKNRVGHGIDPTVRALIGTNNIDENNEDENNNNDESEAASGDVVATAPPPPAVVPTAFQPRQQQQQQQPPQQSTRTTPPPPQPLRSSNNNNNNNNNTIGNPYSINNNYSSPQPPRTGNSVMMQQQSRTGYNVNNNNNQNPYQRNNSNVVSNETTIVAAQQQQQRQTVTMTGNRADIIRSPYNTSNGTSTLANRSARSNNNNLPQSTSTARQSQNNSMNPYATNSSTTATTMTVLQQQANNSNSRGTTTTTSNPYALASHLSVTSSSNRNANKNNTTTATTITTATKPYNNAVGTTTTSTASNPYSRSKNNNTTASTLSTTAAAAATTATTTPSSQESLSFTGARNSNNNSTSDNMIMETTKTSNNGGVTGGNNNSNNNIIYSYQQLYDIIIRAIQDKVAYEHFYGKIFTVQLQQIGIKLHFNIEKEKETNNNQGKKRSYEYVMIAKYRGQCDNDDNNTKLITCKVSSAILEPHFSYAPAEMRKINKQDRSRSDILIRDGGKLVQQSMKQLSCYDVTFLWTCQEFFSEPIRTLDGTKPFLYLIQRK